MKNVKKHKIAIIGGGPAGCFCAYFLQDRFDVTIFEQRSVLATLLPTGGGRCNIAHYEFDTKALAGNYPRGEKFLYSVFSRFATAETLDVFAKIGVDTYVQEDMRIFPKSDSSVDVREKLLSALANVRFKNERVEKVVPESHQIVTKTGKYPFDAAVIAVGGHAGYSFIRALGHKIVEPKPALTALKTKEDLSVLSGVSLQQAECMGLTGDLLFTHHGISGPLVYKISSLKARAEFPYVLRFNLWGNADLQEVLNQNPHKNFKNLLAEFLPKSFVTFILKRLSFDGEQKAYAVDGKMRDAVLAYLKGFELHITAPAAGGEVVTCGGVDLDEVEQKTMASKLVRGVYFCGEVLNIDGFCGGFNLQNCWSTAYCAAEAIKRDF